MLGSTWWSMYFAAVSVPRWLVWYEKNNLKSFIILVFQRHLAYFVCSNVCYYQTLIVPDLRNCNWERLALWLEYERSRCNLVREPVNIKLCLDKKSLWLRSRGQIGHPDPTQLCALFRCDSGYLFIYFYSSPRRESTVIINKLIFELEQSFSLGLSNSPYLSTGMIQPTFTTGERSGQKQAYMIQHICFTFRLCAGRW